MNVPQIEAQRWLRQARADLAVAHTLQAAQHHAAVCFHCQQVAEKALKAVLYGQGARIVLGHSVRELAQQCATHDAAFTALLSDGALLDQFYITTRYPNGLPTPAVPSETFTLAQAALAVQAAERVLRVVDEFLAP